MLATASAGRSLQLTSMSGGRTVTHRRRGLLGGSLGIQLLEQAVDELDRDRALSDRGGHALDGSMPHVAHCEDARHARFEPQRGALEWPASVVWEIRAREQEAVPVSRYL